jgi:hypothetical protein
MKLSVALLAMTLLAAPALGTTVVINSVDDPSWTLNYDGRLDVGGVSTLMDGLTATVTYDVVEIFYEASVDRSFIGLNITVTNTTDASVWQQASITGIGFDTNPDVKRFLSSISGDYGYLAIRTALPTTDGFQVEVCVSGRASTCSGPAGSGTEIGESGSALVYLAFAGDVTALPFEFDNFGVRYSYVRSDAQGITYGRGLGLPVTPPIPEPASAAVFGLGALLVAAAIRRQRAS